MKIRKAVIPVAGLGTRFLPATKSIPKVMLPIVDKPTLLYNVEEIMAAGIEELILVTGHDQAAIKSFFAPSRELEDVLEKSGKRELLNSLREVNRKLKVTIVHQQEALGLGHAVLCAAPAVGREPFAVLLGDEIMITKPGKKSATAQLCEIFENTGTSTVAVMEVAAAEVSKYGVVSVTEQKPGLWKVNDVVEKPSADVAPSRLALPGRYVFTAEIFDFLKDVKPGRNGEIQLTDGMALLAQSQGMLATTVEARRFDAGDKFGFLKANVELALEHPEVGPAFEKYLRQRFGGPQ